MQAAAVAVVVVVYALHPGGRMKKLRLRNAVSDTPFKKVAAMLILRALYSARNNSLPLLKQIPETAFSTARGPVRNAASGIR